MSITTLISAYFSVRSYSNGNGDKENIESGEIKYNHDYFDASTNTIELDKNDILYLYIKIKTNTDNVANKHGVKSRIRIPEFYIVPLV